MIQAIVTDIEGTTTALSFVHKVLFPYSRERLPDFLRRRVNDPEIQTQCDAVRAELNDPSADLETVIATLLEWIAADRKATPLKALQGMLWKEGFENKDYTGHVYPDVPEWLRAWHQRGLKLYVYSSGSVQAQQLLFSHTEFGDVSPLFSGFFDTRTGPKRESSSYQAIARATGHPADTLLFLSDVCAELDAARDAGLSTVLLVRPENPPTECAHPVAHDFVEVDSHVQS